jgi:hypothetical protein
MALPEKGILKPMVSYSPARILASLPVNKALYPQDMTKSPAFWAKRRESGVSRDVI